MIPPFSRISPSSAILALTPAIGWPTVPILFRLGLLTVAAAEVSVIP